MKTWYYIITLIFISGCQSLSINDRDIKAQVVVLQQANKYDAALDVIDHNDQPEQYDLERKAVADARDQYIETQVNLIQTSIELHEWYKARMFLQDALRAVPSSERLQKLSEETDQKERAYIDEKLAIQRLAEGQYLISSLPTFEDITQSAPDRLKYRRELNRMQNRSLSLAKILVQYAQLNFDNQNYQTAQDAIEIAKRLDPTTSAPELEKLLKDHWSLQQRKSNAAIAKQRKKAINILETQLISALSEGNLLEAQQLMAKLWDVDANNPIRFDQQRNLNEALANRIETGLRRGEQLYNAGNITEALTVWAGLLPLQPGHVGLNERIARAKRFLSNLERLQNKNLGS